MYYPFLLLIEAIASACCWFSREMKETHFWQSLRGQTARLAAEL